MVPSPMSWPAGCRFASRCDYAMDRCREEAPPLFATTGTQQAACWKCEHGARVAEKAPV
jgi:oligopeptide/dipeptide ABC transporter ATP-binding protein